MARKLMNSFPVRLIARGGNNLILLIYIGTFTHYFSLPTCLIYLYLDFYKVVTELCAPVNALTRCNFMEIYAPAVLNILSSHKSLAFGVGSFQRPYGVRLQRGTCDRQKSKSMCLIIKILSSPYTLGQVL